jgi:hypothetical protein
MDSSDVVILNDFGVSSVERRTRKSGKSRVSVTIKSEPILHSFDNVELGRGPSEAIAKHLRERVAGIGEQASPATIARRKRALKALSQGDANAEKRYGGGRMGLTPPAQFTTLWSDSGRFAAGIVAGRVEGAWVVNVPANRFDASTFNGGDAGLLRAIDQLRRLVPEMFDPNLLAKVSSVQEAIFDSIGDVIVSASKRNQALRSRRLQAMLGLGRQFVGGFSSVTL